MKLSNVLFLAKFIVLFYLGQNIVLYSKYLPLVKIFAGPLVMLFGRVLLKKMKRTR